MFDQIRRTTIGLNVPTRTVGGTAPRVYLDSAATCLSLAPIVQSTLDYLAYSCANSHTVASMAGRDTTRLLASAHQDVARLFGADPALDSVVMIGSGTTAATCFLADALGSMVSDRDTIVVSEIEHHSNLLPWTRRFKRLSVRCLEDGSLDLTHLQELLDGAGQRVLAVTVTAVSNVTGVITPLPEIARAAHRAGAFLIVDAAQGGAHVPIDMRAHGIDFLVGSGHKMYAPGSPGFLIGPKDFLQSIDWRVGPIGGGSVNRVEPDRVWIKDDPTERFEAGTPNIPGAIALGSAAYLLKRVGMDAVVDHEKRLIDYALARFAAMPDMIVYGPLDTANKTALVSFNVADIPHGLVAAFLSDHHAIMVRNDCFCAQPYVRHLVESGCRDRGFCMIGKTGMVRASLGIYSDARDIDRLVDAIQDLLVRRAEVMGQYQEHDPGSWQHRTFNGSSGFDYRTRVDAI